MNRRPNQSSSNIGAIICMALFLGTMVWAYFQG